ncbi:hypothetical protein LZ30DRAFT_59073 [Colletotrichum cereale]|nr:hypothetical protein LZ30DRAFT_59073 [Colletotrichum cereale]
MPLLADVSEQSPSTESRLLNGYPMSMTLYAPSTSRFMEVHISAHVCLEVITGFIWWTAIPSTSFSCQLGREQDSDNLFFTPPASQDSMRGNSTFTQTLPTRFIPTGWPSSSASNQNPVPDAFSVQSGDHLILGSEPVGWKRTQNLRWVFMRGETPPIWLV